MSTTADDLLPLIGNLSQEEQARIVQFILHREQNSDAPAYLAHPPQADEFFASEEPLAWEAEGWEEFY